MSQAMKKVLFRLKWMAWSERTRYAYLWARSVANW